MMMMMMMTFCVVFGLGISDVRVNVHAGRPERGQTGCGGQAYAFQRQL
jgi:hypothetical protein